MTDAKTITLALKGRWYGRYGVACCPAHGDRRPSLSLSNGADGRLLLRCHAGCGFAEILEALRGLGLVEGTGRCPEPDPAALVRREIEQRADAERRAKQAHACWREAQPITGTLAETYLRRRSITCALPEMLRFHPACWHGATARRLPALVALVEGCDDFAVHRTYLRPNGSGKAEVEPAKAMLGTVAGRAVRLTADPGRLAVAEGIETALSLASGLLRGPLSVWAALSTSGMRSLRLPTSPDHLTIAPDGDEVGHAAAHALAERAHGLGWQVSLLPAPRGQDWNDVLTAKAATRTRKAAQ